MIERAKELLRLQDEIQRLEAEIKEKKQERERVNDELAEEMLDAEMQSMNVCGRVLYLNTKRVASYKKEIADQFFDCLKAHGFGAIIKPNINHNTLNATVREIAENNGGELPEWISDMVDIFEKTTVGIRRA